MRLTKAGLLRLILALVILEGCAFDYLVRHF